MKTEVALGIDIGGTNTAFGFIDQEGNYLAEGNIPTNNHEDLRDYLKELHMAIENTLDSIRDNAILVGIGIGEASHFNSAAHGKSLLSAKRIRSWQAAVAAARP